MVTGVQGVPRDKRRDAQHGNNKRNREQTCTPPLPGNIPLQFSNFRLQCVDIRHQCSSPAPMSTQRCAEKDDWQPETQVTGG